MMRGVMKKISSWLEVLTVVCLNRLPRTGCCRARHLRDGYRVLRLDHAADHHRATVGHEDLGGCLLGDEGRVALNLTAKVRSRVFDVHVQEDGAFRRDLRNHSQPQERIHVSYRGRSTQLRLSHDRNAHALANQSLNVVLGYNSRTGQNFQQAARLSHRKDGIDSHIVAGIDEESDRWSGW